jgi:predicted  nucleic acid-binding Zn-ribbon protein
MEMDRLRRQLSAAENRNAELVSQLTRANSKLTAAKEELAAWKRQAESLRHVDIRTVRARQRRADATVSA